MELTIILPYYRAPLMLKKQLQVVNQYPKGVKVIVIDDCSLEQASDVVTKEDNVCLYRILDNIPWNREGARNLGSMLATTDWIIHMDIDHVLLPDCVNRLLQYLLNKNKWYKFPRYRVGKADFTRNKDNIPREREYGEIKPHIDSYLCTKEMYWKAGGYNENYSGCLGGGGPFLKRMTLVNGEYSLLPKDIFLHVYTSERIKDASVWDLSRDKTEFKRRKKIYGIDKAENPIRFNWCKV